MEPNTFVEAGQQFRMAPLGGSLPAEEDTLMQQGLIEERLPFSVRIVSSEEDLNKAVMIRHSAYGRHIPTVAATRSPAGTIRGAASNIPMTAQKTIRDTTRGLVSR